MHEKALASMQGQLHAISMTLTAVIQSLPELSAAHAALHLKIALEQQLQEEREDGYPAAGDEIRNAVVESYLGLLGSVRD